MQQQTGKGGDSRSPGKMASDTEEVPRTGGRLLAGPWPLPAGPPTHLVLWRGEHRLLLQSCFLRLFLCLPNQLPNEAAWDDREKGRGRGRWGALVLFPNLFCRSKKGKSSVSEPSGGKLPFEKLAKQPETGPRRTYMMKPMYERPRQSR